MQGRYFINYHTTVWAILLSSTFEEELTKLSIEIYLIQTESEISEAQI